MRETVSRWDAHTGLGWRWLAILAVLPIGWSALQDRMLAHDGAYFLQRVLDDGWFFLPTLTRVPADIAQEAPVLLLRLLGVQSLSVLVTAWNATLPVVLLLSVLSSWSALEADNRSAMVLPVLSLSLVTMANDGHLQHEGHLMIAATWPVLFTLLREPEWKVRDRLRLISWGVLLAGSHEAGIPVLIIAGILVARRARQARTAEDRRWAAGVTFLFTIGLATLSVGILRPVHAMNRDAFLRELAWPWNHSFTQIVAGAGLLTIAAWLTKRRSWSAAIGTGWTVLAVAWGSGILSPPSTGETMPLRTLFFTVHAPITYIGTLTLLWARPVCSGGLAACAGAVLAFSTLSVERASRWDAYRTAFRSVLSTSVGFVAVEDTGLLRFPDAAAWNLPLLSRYWANSKIDVVILNRRDVQWQPFDPKRTRVLNGYTVRSRQW